MNEGKGSTSKPIACAACKYRRRKCSKDCIYAPYFPAHQPEIFLNAHRLFGVSNIKRILMEVKNEERDDAMKSIIYESSVRAQFPVHGCWGITCQLQLQIQLASEQLAHVEALLDVCKKLEINNRELCDVSNTNVVDANNNEI